jgi:hypothetical protein
MTNDPFDMLAPDTLTLALPVFVSVSIRVCEFPGRMLPKLRLVGDAASCPVATTPVPDSVALTVVLVVVVVLVLLGFPLWYPFDVIIDPLTDTTPLSLPVAGGVKVTTNDAVCPGESVYGKVNPLTV